MPVPAVTTSATPASATIAPSPLVHVSLSEPMATAKSAMSAGAAPMMRAESPAVVVWSAVPQRTW